MFTKLYIANDHGGYRAKLLLVKYLTELPIIGLKTNMRADGMISHSV